jgi:hypothetical protein
MRVLYTVAVNQPDALAVLVDPAGAIEGLADERGMHRGVPQVHGL